MIQENMLYIDTKNDHDLRDHAMLLDFVKVMLNLEIYLAEKKLSVTNNISIALKKKSTKVGSNNIDTKTSRRFMTFERIFCFNWKRKLRDVFQGVGLKYGLRALVCNKN